MEWPEAACPTYGALVTSALCSTLSLSGCNAGVGLDRDEALSHRGKPTSDQREEGQLLGTALSGDREEFPNVSRIGRGPELSEQRLVLEDADQGRSALGLSTRQRAVTHEDSTAQLVPSFLPTPTLQSESRLQFLWPG